MKALFNDRLVEDQLITSLNNRALQFGDGLFETIIADNTTLPLLKLHYDRLMLGAEVLGINLSLTIGEFEDKIATVLATNEQNEFSRVKVIVWRGEDQQLGYHSQSNRADILITIKPAMKPAIRIIEAAAFSKNVALAYHSFSSLKTISALPYIMAAAERSAEKVDELILLDGFGNVSECVSSNLFWIAENQIFTASLNSGCIAGVMRQHIINLLASKGINVQEVMIKKDELLQSELIFTTNVAGIGVIKSIGDNSYSTSNTSFDQIKQLLAL